MDVDLPQSLIVFHAKSHYQRIVLVSTEAPDRVAFWYRQIIMFIRPTVKHRKNDQKSWICHVWQCIFDAAYSRGHPEMGWRQKWRRLGGKKGARTWGVFY